MEKLTTATTEVPELVAPDVEADDIRTWVLPRRYDEALLGWCEGEDGFRKARAVYSIRKIIKVLEDLDDMTYDDAYEFFEYNIAGAFIEPIMPLYISEVDHVG